VITGLIWVGASILYIVVAILTSLLLVRLYGKPIVSFIDDSQVGTHILTSFFWPIFYIFWGISFPCKLLVKKWYLPLRDKAQSKYEENK